MARIFLMLHLVAVFVGVQVVGTYTSYGGGADNNGHAAKKSPMDYSRYADDVRNIANHDSDHNLHRSNACDDRFELKNSTIIRTKDSMFSGAQFVDDTKVSAATECRRLCCDKDDDCDTAVFVDDIAKDKNCFLFKCRIDDSMKCKFSSHVGYVSAMVGGFDVVARSGVQTESDRGNDDDDDDDDNERQQARDEGDVKKTGFDVKQDAAATPENDGSNQDEEADVEDEGCRDDQIQCANGDCIIARYVCNDVEDCTDGSDEMGCKYDTNTPSSSHSSHATNHPKIGPNSASNQGQQEQTKAPQKMRLGDIRSELASELHEQSSPDDEQRDSHDEDKIQDADGKPEFDENRSDRADKKLQSLQDEDEVDERDGENYDDGDDTGTAEDTDEAGKDKVADSDYVQPNSREHQGGAQPDTSDEQQDDRKPNLHHLSGEDEDLKGQAQGNDFRTLKTYDRHDERLEGKEQPKMSHLSDDRVEQDQEQRDRQQSKGHTYAGDDTKFRSQSARVDSKHRPVLPNDERDDPNYSRQQMSHKNPIGPDRNQEKETPDRLNYYPNSDSRENLYPYDDYGTNFNDKPFPETPDYNYPDNVFDDVHAGDPGRDRFDNRNPLYQDLQDDRFDPDQDNYINYHRRDRLNKNNNNNNNYNYPVEDPPEERRRPDSDRPRLYDRLPVEDDWSRREEEGDSGMGDGDRRQGRQRVNGRPYQGRFKPDDAASSQQNRAGGSWKHWNNYNHPDSTYPGDDRDRSDEGLSRENEVDDAVNQGDAQDGSEGNDASQDKGPEDSVVPTGNDNEHSDNDDSQDVPPQSSPKPAVDPLKEVSSAPVDSKGDGAHPPSAAAAAVPKVVSGKSQVSTPKSVDLGDPTLRKATPHGIQPATSAILPLAVGLIITLFLLMMLSCRLRYMNRRLRYGRLKTHAHDADYLINGMYL